MLRLSFYLFLVYCLTACNAEAEQQLTEEVPVVIDTFAYSQLVPEGIRLHLPNIMVDSSLLQQEEGPTVNCFLGFDETSDSLRFALGLSSEGNKLFSDINSWAEQEWNKIPERIRNRLRVHLWIDQDVPYYVVNYMELHLRENGMLRIRYRTADGKAFPVSLPPHEGDQCSSMSNRPCKRKKGIRPENQTRLQNMELGADWNPTIKYEEFVLRPENIFPLTVQAGDALSLAGKSLSTDSLYLQAYAFLHGPGPATKKIFKVRIADEASYGNALASQVAIKQAYQDTWEQMSQTEFGRPFSTLERLEMIKVKNKWPTVIWLDRERF